MTRPERREIEHMTFGDWNRSQKYRRTHRAETIRAGLTTAEIAGEPRYVYATALGYTVDNHPPIGPLQAYYICAIEPAGGTVRLIAVPGVGAAV